MKLAVLAIITTLGLGGAAYAEPAHPRGELRQFLLQRFDRNQDGRLEQQERRKAIRMLRRVARRLAMQDRDYRHDARGRGMLRRFDAHGDGAVGPQEMPRRGERRFDANGDGAVGPQGMPRRGERGFRSNDRDRDQDRDRDEWLDDTEQPLPPAPPAPQ